MADVRYDGADAVIIHEKNLPAAFFDLSTRLAGEILQKFTTYHLRLAIVGDFSAYKSNSLERFIEECNRGNQVFFVADKQKAIELFSNRLSPFANL